MSLDPTNYGWSLIENEYVPVYNKQQTAPRVDMQNGTGEVDNLVNDESVVAEDTI